MKKILVLGLLALASCESYSDRACAKLCALKGGVPFRQPDAASGKCGCAFDEPMSHVQFDDPRVEPPPPPEPPKLTPLGPEAK